jgi:hypothetical protein
VAVRLGPDGAEPTTVRQALRDRRFRLTALAAGMRPGAVAVLVVIVAWSALIALNAAGGGVPADALGGTGFGLMGVPGWGPPAVRVGTVAALGVAVVVAAGAAVAAGWPEGRATRLVRRGVLAGAGLAGLALVTRASLDADGLWAELLTVPAAPVGPARWVAAFRVVAAKGLVWSGVAAALALPFVPLSGAWSRRAAVALAAAPFLAYLAATVLAGDLGSAWLANADYRDDRLYNFAGGLELVLVLYVVWELTTWTGFVSELAAYGARARRVGAAVVAGLLAVKLAWLGLGLAGLLPGVLGGHAGVWARMGGDGTGSWLTAVVLAGVLLAWLAVAPRVVDPHPVAGAGGTAFLLVALLCLPGLAAGMLLGLYRSVRDLTPAGPYDLAARVALVLAVAVLAGGLLVLRATTERRGRPAGPWPALAALGAAGLLGTLVGAAMLAELIQRTEDLRTAATAWGAPQAVGLSLEELAGGVAAHYFLVPGLAFAAALVLVLAARRRGRAAPTAAVFALALAGVALLYTLPRLGQVPLHLDQQALGATGDLLAPQSAYQVFPLAAPAWERWWRGPAGGFELATLDAVLTVGLCGLALWCWRRGRPGWPAAALFVLLVSTVLAHSATLAPTGWAGSRWFYLALLFPVAAQFLYRGGELNETAARRPELVLLSLAAIALLLTLLGYRLLTGLLDPTVDLENAMLGYTRGFTVELILLPLGLAAVALRLRRSQTA